jgi:hypothetical protein
VLFCLVPDSPTPRAFKSAWFARAVRKARIGDAALCKAIAQVMAGQADDLGGGVFKKRLSNNQYRSIILARGGDYWVYEFLFAKQDMANIDDSNLARLRAIAKGYGTLKAKQVARMVADRDWIEICQGELEQES